MVNVGRPGRGITHRREKEGSAYPRMRVRTVLQAKPKDGEYRPAARLGVDQWTHASVPERLGDRDRQAETTGFVAQR